MTPASVEGSLWSAASSLLSEELAAFDLTELEATFATRPTKSRHGDSAAAGGATTPRGGIAYVTLLDVKRATNAGIALARLGLPHGGALPTAILELDDTKLCLNKASALLAVAPTPEEAELLRAYDGDPALLGSTERYFLELLSIPRLTQRLKSWVVQQRFEAQAADLLDRQRRLTATLVEMSTCGPLHTALALLLELGNRLNAGTARANAAGVRIDSLSQLVSTRSSSSVLGFLVRHAHRADPTLIDGIRAATARLGTSCRLDANEMASELSCLVGDLTAATRAVEAHERAEVEAEAAKAEAKKAEDEAKAAEEAEAYQNPLSGAAIALAALNAAMTQTNGVVDDDDDGEQAPTADADAPPAAAAGPTDRFGEVMRPFVNAAQSEIAEVQTSAEELSVAAKGACTFFCERDDMSVAAAHTLLVRVHAFGAAIIGAHDQAEAEKAAALQVEAKEAKMKAKAARTPSGAPADGFEASDSSLRAIMEDDEDGGAEAPTLFSTPFKGAPTTRRLTALKSGGDDGGFKSPDELKLLFTRRATTGSMMKSDRATPGTGNAKGVATPGIETLVDTPGIETVPCSPGKRPRME